MSPRGAAFLVVLLVLALGGYAGWLVGIPTPVVALVAGLVFGVAVRRLRKSGSAKAASAPSGSSNANPPKNGPGVGSGQS